ncbi:hypothetical protein [Paraburkholderia hospita]|uniref:hypothetical protein n=1 Tax=Paraburkholderia hospita TaxID=169430 RepID=UPI001055CDE5|nr:hypothetical protein [Paraburkholderia hospita]
MYELIGRHWNASKSNPSFRSTLDEPQRRAIALADGAGHSAFKDETSPYAPRAIAEQSAGLIVKIAVYAVLLLATARSGVTSAAETGNPRASKAAREPQEVGDAARTTTA